MHTSSPSLWLVYTMIMASHDAHWYCFDCLIEFTCKIWIWSYSALWYSFFFLNQFIRSRLLIVVFRISITFWIFVFLHYQLRSVLCWNLPYSGTFMKFDHITKQEAGLSMFYRICIVKVIFWLQCSYFRNTFWKITKITPTCLKLKKFLPKNSWVEKEMRKYLEFNDISQILNLPVSHAVPTICDCYSLPIWWEWGDGYICLELILSLL